MKPESPLSPAVVPGKAPALPLGLALAVVTSSTAPLLLLDENWSIVALSGSFCQQFGLPGDKLVGTPIFSLGHGEWNMPRLRSLLDATLSGAVDAAPYEIDLALPGLGTRRLVLNAHNLNYGDDSGPPRILLSVNDVTDSRRNRSEMEELLQDKAVLLQEVQHRVANSLQIVASVLMQSARKVQSEETRTHLRDAHNRVMSIAALQRQLATTSTGDVALGDYFSQLCKTLGASMIADHDRLSVTVTTDDSKVPPDVSVSLGLIVTELVINALKHAFPGERRGRIMVDYRSEGGNWVLLVSDDGVGMAPRVVPVVPGLGTSIVNALARHLKAQVSISDTGPGTSVAIAHDGSEIRESDVPAAEPAI